MSRQLLLALGLVTAGCSGAPRPGPRPPSPPPTRRELALEREVFRLTNQVRRRHRLPRFTFSSAYSTVARDHSRDMRDNDFLGHDSPGTGSPADRLTAAGLAFRAVRENVARAPSPAETVRNLMNSPSHRENILARNVTHLGVGVVVDAQEQPPLLVTQLFVTPGTAYNPATAGRDALRIIERRRRQAGLRPLRVDAALDRLARRAVELDEGDARAALVELLEASPGRYSSVVSARAKVSVLDAFEKTTAYMKPHHTHLGLGIKQVGAGVVIHLILARVR